jgi:hypothetical protein
MPPGTGTDERRLSVEDPHESLGDADDMNELCSELLRTLTGVRGLGVDGLEPKEGCVMYVRACSSV